MSHDTMSRTLISRGKRGLDVTRRAAKLEREVFDLRINIERLERLEQEVSDLRAKVERALGGCPGSRRRRHSGVLWTGSAIIRIINCLEIDDFIPCDFAPLLSAN